MEIDKIVSAMTLEEKASYVSGASSWTTDEIPRLNVPAIFMSDGPHGLRKISETAVGQEGIYDSIEAVCFPAACATAASFDRNLLKRTGETLGQECQAEDVGIILGPAVNIKRSPLCGRNFEYMSEDPYVAGELSAAYISGVQSQNVGTSIKHFAANNTESERMYSSSEVSERALREIYLAPFERAVKKSQPWTVMASYNRINGTYSSENKWLLTDVLRKEWGFEGFVMSDWGAVSNRVAGVLAGLNLEMPGSGKACDEAVIQAVKDGTLPEEQLDEMVTDILRIVEKFTEHRIPGSFDREADHQKAVASEEQCIVLLKNKENVLPLKAEEKVALIGGFAESPRYQGGGSSHIHAHKVSSALSVSGEYSDSLQYAKGFPADRDSTDTGLEEEAVKTAAAADKIVVFAGLPDSFESEGYDRTHLRLPDCQNRLIRKLAELGKPLIVVLHNGAPVEMPWEKDVAGIVEAYLGGEGVGEAVMNILYGRTNPSGRLAETFPLQLEDNPSYLNFPTVQHKVYYREDVFVGYRYYDTKKMEVLFPFGHGLSYTEFTYRNLKIDRQFDIRKGLSVSVEVTNTGDRDGAEVVQLYVADRTGTAVRPAHELKGFEKIFLNAGETKTVTFHLNARSFQWFDEDLHDWYAANGTYTIEIGKSSRDIVLSQDVELTGSPEILPVIDENVQVGDLLRCSKTKKYVETELREPLLKFAGADSFDNLDGMTEAMIQFMPLRSLRSFAHLRQSEIDQIVEDLKNLTEE